MDFLFLASFFTFLLCSRANLPTWYFILSVDRLEDFFLILVILLN
jgi:hypothetical protein